MTASSKNYIRKAEIWISLGLHPHIVSRHYVRTLDDIPRVFVEFVDGGSLIYARPVETAELPDGQGGSCW